MEALEPIYEGAVELFMRFKRQFERTSNEMTSQTLSRLAFIIGVYLVLRPFAVRFMDWTHKKEMAREERKKKEAKAKAKNQAKANISPNELRTGKVSEKADISSSDDSDLDSDSDSGEVRAEATGAVLTEDDLDKKARRRQRKLDRARENAAEMRKFEEKEWDDPDLEDLLVGRP